VLVRPAREHEIDTIADIYVASFRGLTFLPRLHSDEEMRDWVRRVMVPGHEVSVGELNGRVVGFASLRDGLLGHFYVIQMRRVEASEARCSRTSSSNARKDSSSGSSNGTTARDASTSDTDAA